MNTEEREIVGGMANLPGIIVDRKSKEMWVIWKIVAAVLMFGIFMDMFVYEARQDYPFKELFYFTTNLAIIFEAIYMISSCVLCFKLYKHNGLLDVDNSSNLDWNTLLAWSLHDLVMPLVLLVSIMFWWLLYSAGEKDLYETILKHAVNTAIIVPDMFFSPLPHRLMHIYIPLAFVVLYEIWTVIHDAVGLGNSTVDGNYIYSIVDWENSVSTALIYCVLVIVVMSILHVVTTVTSLIMRALKSKEKPHSLADDNLELAAHNSASVV